MNMDEAHRELLHELGDRASKAVAVPNSASSYEAIDVAISALEQATAGTLDAQREFVLRQLASEKCTGGWGYDDCLEANAMHLCPSCFVKRYLRTGDATLRATEHLAAQCIAGAIRSYQDTFKRNGRLDFTYRPDRNEVEVHAHTDEDGDAEPYVIFPRV